MTLIFDEIDSGVSGDVALKMGNILQKLATHHQIAIIGGGVGGCAAALAAAQAGQQIILTEESDWIGGQLTSQAVPPDEHGWIEKFALNFQCKPIMHAVQELAE